MKKLLALSVLALLVAACGFLPRKTAAPSETHPPGGTSTAPAPVLIPRPAKVPAARTSGEVPPPPSAGSIADNAYGNGSAALKEGLPDRALDLFADAWKEAPGHPGVAQTFPVALDRLKKQGDEADQLGNPEKAGKAWMKSLSYLSHPAVKGKPLSFTRSDLKENLERLSKSLMDKGLVEYREGRFESAISWWQKILSYDPANKEAVKSVQTATTQLENLKKISPKK